MGDKNPKQKQKLKKQHQEEMARRQAQRQSHTHRFNADGGEQNGQGGKDQPWQQHKKAG